MGFVEVGILAVIILAFITFGGVLAWADMRTRNLSHAANTAPDKHKLEITGQ